MEGWMFVVICVFFCFFGGLLGGGAVSYLLNLSLMGQLATLQKKMAGVAGGEGMKLKSQRFQEAMGFVVQKQAEGGKMEDIIKEAALNYPDVALQLAGKFLKKEDKGGSGLWGA